MSKQEAKGNADTGPPKQQEDSTTAMAWTTDNHLVGKSLDRSVIVPYEEHQHIYVTSAQSIPATLFQAEDIRARKPALWRGLLQRPQQPLPLAMDVVPSDWQQHTTGSTTAAGTASSHSDLPPMPTKANLARTAERLQATVYEQVVQDLLPELILKAALEEVRDKYLTQAAREAQLQQQQQQSQQSPATKGTKGPSVPPLYYHKHPNSYLTPPENTLSSSQNNSEQQQHHTPLVQFTPSNLVQRIKAGCALAWSATAPTRPVIVATSSSSTPSNTRASSRLARLERPSSSDHDAKDDARYLWDVQSGGTIAAFLLDEFLSKKEKGATDTTTMETTESSTTAVKEEAMDGDQEETPVDDDDNDDDEEDNDSDHVPEEEDDDDDVDPSQFANPYLQPSQEILLEWLGRKTAKLMSSTDIQGVFPMFLMPTKKKSKKKAQQDLAQAGRAAQSLMTPIDREIWQQITSSSSSSSNLDDPSARLVMECVAYEDTSDMQEWETGLFARAQFALRVVVPDDGNSSAEATAQEWEEYARLEKAFKDQKAWEVARYKAIHSGCTIWPSWTEAVMEWKKSITGGSDDAVMETEETGADLAVARAIADEEESNQRSSRRSRRGGDGGGVFYGQQSGLNLKSLMETLCRQLSSKSFASLADLMAQIPDESTDPMRRMRNALGRLVWKRHQLCRLPVSSILTDLPVWKRLDKGSLLTVDESINGEERDPVETQSLLEYISYLHRTELQLRDLVIKNLGRLPASVVACAADEKNGTMESMDYVSFEDLSSVDWQKDGHDLIGKDIFRPAVQFHSDGAAVCEWFRVIGYTPSVPWEPEEGEPVPEKAQIGKAKENRAVERRARFQVIPYNQAVASETEPSLNGQLVLTEAQVYAGMKAAEIENSETFETEEEVVEEHPFAGKPGAKVSLIPDSQESSKTPLSGTVVGWDSVYINDNSLRHDILVFPEKGQSREESFRVTLSASETGLIGTIDGEDGKYILQQFDYHSTSEAFKECRYVVGLLERHSKASPFLDPVDPVALGIPHYFDVIKKPMDISTLSKKLEQGEYSNILPKDAVGRTPVSRMLNGPFRKDVELIFDNAMNFNPPDDWIHLSALAVKKYIVKKIEQISSTAEARGPQRQKKSSVYMDDDSDVDMYQYESDKDDDYNNYSRGSRKRKQSAARPSGEDTSTRAIERGIKLQKVIGDSHGQLKGALSNLPLNMNASSFSLPHGWNCEKASAEAPANEQEQTQEEEEPNELTKLVSLKSAIDQREATGLRRSTRASDHEHKTSSSQASLGAGVEFVHKLLDKLKESDSSKPRNRQEIELILERLHEEYFVKVYSQLSGSLLTSDKGDEASNLAGLFRDNSFPPYMGRVVPTAPASFKGDIQWEIRAQYVIPAIRWVIRGLIASGHFAEVEPLTTDSAQSGAILPNHVYYLDPAVEPFDILAQKEMQRRKRAEQVSSSESEEEVELSEYEKRRAERVARNADRLKQLGLA